MGEEDWHNQRLPRERGEEATFVQRHWIPAWQFLETSPCGLVFAGMTIP